MTHWISKALKSVTVLVKSVIPSCSAVHGEFIRGNALRAIGSFSDGRSLRSGIGEKRLVANVVKSSSDSFSKRSAGEN